MLCYWQERTYASTGVISMIVVNEKRVSMHAGFETAGQDYELGSSKITSEWDYDHLLPLSDHLLNPAISVQRLVEKHVTEPTRLSPRTGPASGARFARNWMFRWTGPRSSFATETAWFASDSAKDTGTSSLGGAISRKHLMYEPEKTCRKDWKCKFLRCKLNC